MNKYIHSNEECYCHLFQGDGMPEGAICKPCFQDGCVCMEEDSE